MIKFIIYSILSAVLLIWLSQNNGFIQINWLGYQITIELIFLIPVVILIKLLFLQLVLLLSRTRKSQQDTKRLSAISSVINGLSYLKIGDNISARNCIVQAKKVLPEEAIMKLLEANDYILKGNLKGAKNSLMEIVNGKGVLTPTALNQMLEISYKEHDILEVENIINKITKLFPKDPWALLKIGEFCCNIKKYEEALTNLQKVSKSNIKLDYDLNYKITMLCYAIAKTAYNQQNYNKALKYLRSHYKAIVGISLLKAKIYYSLNKRKKSLNLLEDAHQQNPHHDIIKSYVEYGGDINRLSSIVEDDQYNAWQCTSCYKKSKEWDYICSKCDLIGTIYWL